MKSNTCASNLSCWWVCDEKCMRLQILDNNFQQSASNWQFPSEKPYILKLCPSGQWRKSCIQRSSWFFDCIGSQNRHFVRLQKYQLLSVSFYLLLLNDAFICETRDTGVRGPLQRSTSHLDNALSDPTARRFPAHSLGAAGERTKNLPNKREEQKRRRP